MSLSLELLNVLSLILPGLLAMKIQDMIISSEDRPTHEQIILALIYSYLIYLLSALTFTTWEPLISFKTEADAMVMNLSTNKKQLVLVIVLSIFLPFIYSWAHQKDIPMKWLRKMKVTKKASMANTWADTFHNESRMINIHLKDEREVRGWPHRYSSIPNEGYIYLTYPTWVNHEGTTPEDYYIETNAHGFLIAIEDIDFIEFALKSNENPENITEGDWNE